MPRLRNRLPRWLRQMARTARRRGRKIWSNDDRIHIALRELTRRERQQLASALATALEPVPGVRWVRVNAHLGYAIVACTPDAPPAASGAREAFEERLAATVAQVEGQLGLHQHRFPSDHPEQHPGDLLPVARTALEMGTKLAALGTGALLRAAGVKPPVYEIDLAALLALIHSLPGLRKNIERYATIAGTEVLLELFSSVIYALRQSETGPVVGILHRTLRLRELHARRALWSQWEPALCASPDAHQLAPAELPPRPGELPAGAMERYADNAGLASLAAFGLGIVATGSVEKASGLLFAGIPRPARLGRDAFASHLGRHLARAGVMVMEPQILRRFDRLDCAVIDRRLLAGQDPVARDLVRAVRRARLELVAATDAREEVAWAGIRAITGADVVQGVRALQEEGHGVCVIGSGCFAGYAAADCAIALWEPDAGPCWDAHILCRAPDQVMALCQAIAGAHEAAGDSMHLAMIESIVGLAISYTGLDVQTTRRIMTAGNAATLVSIGNAVRLASRVRVPAHERLATPATTPPWHRMEAGEVLSALGSSSEAGLDQAQSAERRPPRQEEPPPIARWLRMVGDELANPMAPILAAGAGLSLVAGELTDAALVTAALGLNGVVGGSQRYHIEKALRQLSRDEQRKVRVRREGRDLQLDAGALVPGDIIELTSGEVVPADCRIIAAAGLEVDESSLTGESLPVTKDPAPTDAAAVAERSSMLYAGTAVAAGNVTAVVVAVGADTEALRAMLLGAEAAGGHEGVEHRLSRLVSLTAPVAAASGLALAAAGMLRGQDWRKVLSAGVSLAVAAVPEGLPILATLAQLAVAGRLSERGALVRNPRAVEALGRVDVLCADKTGTLTEGRIQLAMVSDGVTHQRIGDLDETRRAVLAVALRATPSPSNGDPLPHLTDRALVEGAQQAGVVSQGDMSDWEHLHELPFEPSRGYHAGLSRFEGGRIISVKGAPEVILERCARWHRDGATEDLDHGGRAQLAAASHDLARQGYRVLAVAERGAHEQTPLSEERVQDLSFRGFVALADPVRDTARQAVRDLRRAGVSIIMVTGDHPSTAEAIASELGLRNGSRVLTGADIDRMDDDTLARELAHTAVCARVTPMDKVRIVRALKRAGRVVAMTGDGANDAPAIRLADVGIALGEGSTTAARQAADMVVTDERIETIVHAALEGRALWTSVRDAVAILVGGNLGEILYTLVGGLLSSRSPLNVRQLLLVNLITDTFPALAIALRPPAHTTPEQLMREGPDASLGDALTRDILWRAAITAGSASAARAAARLGGERGANTVGLLALTGSQLAQTLMVGTHSLPVIATSLGSFAGLVAIVETPGLSHFFGCRPLGPVGLAQASAAMAASVGAHLVLPRAADRVITGVRRWQERRREPAATTAAGDGAAGNGAAGDGAAGNGAAGDGAADSPASGASVH